MQQRDRFNAWRVSEQERKYKHKWRKKLGLDRFERFGRGVIRIDDAVDQWKQDSGYEKQLDDVQLFIRWDDIVGKHVAKYMAPVKLERGRLQVKVEDDVLRHQFHYIKQEIIDTINRTTGRTTVTDIVLTG